MRYSYSEALTNRGSESETLEEYIFRKIGN